MLAPMASIAIGGTETMGASIEWQCDSSSLLIEAFRHKGNIEIDLGLVTEAMGS